MALRKERRCISQHYKRRERVSLGTTKGEEVHLSTLQKKGEGISWHYERRGGASLAMSKKGEVQFSALQAKRCASSTYCTRKKK